MTTLDRSTYMKKYVGSYDDKKTKTYLKKGINMKKYAVKPTSYDGVFKILRKSPHLDTTGYFIDGKYYRSKNNIDKALKSKKQSWEKKK